MYKNGFSSELYAKAQSAKIAERVSKFNKLYLEFGGKLFDDYHASRVLPGFEPDNKIKMLLELKGKVEVILAINANDVEKSKTRSDIGVTYTQDLLNKIDAFKKVGLDLGGVVITHFVNQTHAINLRKKLEKLDIKVAYHYIIENYPNNLDLVLSENGFGKNEYIKTSKEIVVVTAPGPGSGKLATCLSQMYHDNLNGIKSGYTKFETFPVWNLPLNHAVNLAYESATVDLSDVNLIDPFHLEKYGSVAINYNRDVEAFPIVNELLTRILGKELYFSPTDMGCNMIASGITDNEVCIEASKQEIIRRYYECLVKAFKDEQYQDEVLKHEQIMSKANVKPEDRKCVVIAKKIAEETHSPSVAIELADGTIITGKTKNLLGACSAALLNAIKYLAKLDDRDLLQRENLEPIQVLKTEYLKSRNPRLHMEEVLLALAIGSKTDDNCKIALESLKQLRNAEAHSTVILSRKDMKTFKKLGINLTMEPTYELVD